ncbi:hypothetical protein AKJ61_02275 [candidate division MSBL1 archaeon SCGC-AAA259B11]|uniref:Uncharacterized protein n=1 Tax=candidate division MSBL1 archaeon SCGC-AAA259B11 TaxID=1698260 RepID=A0A133U6B8_9EURY|nr:hypothetical protein AKJ61_02275 [candidate division MSBL1 archaeon SCGC-AAA259B11]
MVELLPSRADLLFPFSSSLKGIYFVAIVVIGAGIGLYLKGEGGPPVSRIEKIDFEKNTTAGPSTSCYVKKPLPDYPERLPALNVEKIHMSKSEAIDIAKDEPFRFRGDLEARKLPGIKRGGEQSPSNWVTSFTSSPPLDLKACAAAFSSLFFLAFVGEFSRQVKPFSSLRSKNVYEKS